MTTFAVLAGNRGFFPAELCEQGRKAVLAALKAEGIEAVMPNSAPERQGLGGRLKARVAELAVVLDPHVAERGLSGTALRCWREASRRTARSWPAPWGGFGVAKIPRLQPLPRRVCREGYEHHVAINPSSVAGVVQEALGRCLGWDAFNHDAWPGTARASEMQERN